MLLQNSKSGPVCFEEKGLIYQDADMKQWKLA